MIERACIKYKLVTWPTKISDDTLAFLFNKCNIFHMGYNFEISQNNYFFKNIIFF